jgi:hypothetical protein
MIKFTSLLSRWRRFVDNDRSCGILSELPSLVAFAFATKSEEREESAMSGAKNNAAQAAGAI